MTHEDEYHDNMVTMLELIWGEGYMAPGGPGNPRPSARIGAVVRFVRIN